MVSKPLIARHYDRIHRFLGAHKSVLVLGPRGSGKTSFLGELVKTLPGALLSIDLLRKLSFDRYLRQPELLSHEIVRALETSERLTVFIDEIQKLPFLLDEIHHLIEQHKPRVTFLLTGSSARKLKRENANLLAGRALSVEFFPLGIDEIDFEASEAKVLEYGTLPEVFLEDDLVVRREFLHTYVGTYLDEEINREADVRNLPAFAQFLELAAVENGTPVNYRKISRGVGIADVTVKDYYELLVDTLVAYRIPAWTHSIREQLTKAPKFYLFDNGVVNALTSEFSAELRPSTNRFGRLFENFVVTQLVQQLSKARSPLKLYHYREHTGREIDIILQKNPHTPPVAIEIKSGTDPSVDSVKQLLYFQQLYPSATCLVICRTPQPYVTKGIRFCSLPEAVKFLCSDSP
jgi:predicted AAA+ superfamily ATPase